MTDLIVRIRVARLEKGRKQHSFEELGLLDGNNHCGRKTRLKIATDCSDAVESCNSSTIGCFFPTHKVDAESWMKRLPLTVISDCISILRDFHSTVAYNYF